MPSKKRATTISLQPLDALFGTNEETTNGISEIAIGSLHPFPNHPFQVKDDKKMEELSDSITQYGVLVPGIVRLRESGGYEIVAGHRRKRACELAGLEKMPVIIKDLTDDEATVIMVDSNIQREELLISEKAFAYKMKYEALKRQGKRSDLTSCQVGKKLAAEEVSQNTGDSSRQILRYIHLTELVAELLELADEKKLPFNTAVEVSYLRTEEQQILLQYMHNPVSYTHLDVYKRQEIYNPWSVINYISKGCLPQAYWVNTGKNEILDAVSYTHLDVYKRQEQGCF